MRILVSGSTGLIGSALAESLAGDGHAVARLIRPQSESDPQTGDDVAWDPSAGTIDADALAGFDAVVHLAGEPIAGRWNEQKKRRIMDSRRQGTRVLAEALANLPAANRPGVLVSASAVGYYGGRGDEPLTADSRAGEIFLSEVCRQWEAAADAAREANIRVAHPRLGVVLDRRAGALAAMLRPFRLGLGGPVGSGRQYLSWVSLPDTVAALRRLIDDDSLAGPVNVGSPNPVTNAEFARRLGRALRRPAFLRTPAFAIRLAMGEMAENLVLPSARMIPQKLLDAGFEFQFPQLPEALAEALR